MGNILHTNVLLIDFTVLIIVVVGDDFSDI